MTVRIIDASVAVKWFVDEAVGSEAARSVLLEIRDAPRGFAVPELFFNEMLAVFRKLGLGRKAIVRDLSFLEDLGLARIGNGRELLHLAAELAVDHGIGGYDAVYVATARLLRGTWLTFDRRASAKLQGTGICELLEG